MTAVRVRRPRRGGQFGFGLIEAAVTIFIVGVSIVTLVEGLATAEQSAGVDTRKAHIQVALRTLADELRDVVAYSPCTTGGSGYRNALNQPPLSVPGTTVTSVGVNHATVPSSGSRLTQTCSSPRDYGVQHLTITARQGPTTASIEVWKSADVMATAAPTPTPTPTPTPGGGGGGG